VVHKTSARHAIGRVKHFEELFNLNDDELRLLLDAQYREQEYKGSEEFLSEEEQYWQVMVYGADVDSLYSDCKSIDFSLTLDFEDTSTETFLDVVYPHFVNRFEEEYGDSVDELLYYPPERVAVNK